MGNFWSAKEEEENVFIKHLQKCPDKYFKLFSNSMSSNENFYIYKDFDPDGHVIGVLDYIENNKRKYILQQLSVINGYLVIRFEDVGIPMLKYKLGYKEGHGGVFVNTHRSGNYSKFAVSSQTSYFTVFRMTDEVRAIRESEDTHPKMREFIDFLHGPLIPNLTLDTIDFI